MLAAETVREIERLLAQEKISQRKIAELLGVSRGTVGAIASGKRPDYDALFRQNDDEPDEPTGPPERCPGCGGLVYMPCLLCRLRNRGMQKPNPTFPGLKINAFEPMELNLRPEHRSRYEEVLARRIHETSMPT